MPQRTHARFVQPRVGRSRQAKNGVVPAFRVHVRSPRATVGQVTVGNNHFRCALGRSGSRVMKREGDGATPIGHWRLQTVFYRPDRMPRPRSRIPIKVLRTHDGWCDAPADRNYNRLVRLPYPASCEPLWRSDPVYDIVVVLAHNSRPRHRFGGSAIFVHVARPHFTPTEGCIALSRTDLLRFLAVARHGSYLSIGARHR